MCKRSETHRACLVRLAPKDMRYKGSINLGAEIIKREILKHGWEVDDVYFGDRIVRDRYDLIVLNIFYITHQLNLLPFLEENLISHTPEKRAGRTHPLIIAGGPGMINPKPISQFLDGVVIGEGEQTIHKVLSDVESKIPLHTFDGFWCPSETIDIPKRMHIDTVDSHPVISGGNTVIELTRGCKYRCKFCQYGCTSGKYREKDISLVLKQIDCVKLKGVKNINFLSCNLCGYSNIEELLNYCIHNGIRVMNTDARIDQYFEVAELFNALKIRTIKTGIESFTEGVRYNAGKAISEATINEFLNTAKHYTNNIHFYMIYGLPGETDYSEWLKFPQYAKNQIKDIKSKIRIEYNITNFEPSPGTPFEKETPVNFDEKHVFLKRWLKELELAGYLSNSESHWYKNMKGRLGRKPETYNSTMWLINAGVDAGQIIESMQLRGVSRSMKEETTRKILNAVKL